DVVSLGNGDDRFIWNPGDGSDLVDGDAGTDTLQFNGADASERISVLASGDRALILRNAVGGGGISLDLGSIEHIQIAAGGGADTINVADLTGSPVTQVAIDLAGSSKHAGDGMPDQVSVNGTAGDDIVTIARRGGDVTVSGLAATVSIT